MYVIIFMYTYIHVYIYIHIYIYKYLIYSNSPCLLTTFLINIYNTICDINVHSFFCRDIILP